MFAHISLAPTHNLHACEVASPELVAQQQPPGNISILAVKCHGGGSNCGWCCKIDGPQDEVTLGTSGVQMGFWISRLKRPLCVHLPRIEGAVDKVSRAACQWRVEHLPQRRLLTPDDFNVAECPAWNIVLVHVLWNGHWGYLFTQGLPDKLCEMGKEKTPKKRKEKKSPELEWHFSFSSNGWMMLLMGTSATTRSSARSTSLLLLFSRKGSYPKSYRGNEVDNKTLQQSACSGADISLKMLKTTLFR